MALFIYILITYVKNLFQGIASIILCKRYVSSNIKDGVPNKPNSMNFRTEIGLNVIF